MRDAGAAAACRRLLCAHTSSTVNDFRRQFSAVGSFVISIMPPAPPASRCRHHGAINATKEADIRYYAFRLRCLTRLRLQHCLVLASNATMP